MTERVSDQQVPDSIVRRNRRTLVICTVTVFAMIGLSFAAVPLYRMFCQVTGFGGTPLISKAELDPSEATGRMIKVRFNADTDQRLPWQFHADQVEMNVEIGRSALAYFNVKNRAARPTIGMAVYNVSPPKAGEYFHKVQCFCFNAQALAAGESVDMPVLFYVDPSILDDRKMEDVDTITLSYTFFPADQDDLDEKVGAYYDRLKSDAAAAAGGTASKAVKTEEPING
jgi:cytochrome c oxidase assembly protein subunit 11